MFDGGDFFSFFAGFIDYFRVGDGILQSMRSWKAGCGGDGLLGRGLQQLTEVDNKWWIAGAGASLVVEGGM